MQTSTHSKGSVRLSLILCVLPVLGCDSEGIPGPEPTGEVEGLFVGPANRQVAVDAPLQLTAHEFLSGGDFGAAVTTRAAWTSADEDIATVSDAGTVTGVAPGSCEISALHGGFTARVFVQVVPKLVEIQVTPFVASAAAGTTRGYRVMGVYSDHGVEKLAERVTWSSSDAVVVAMDATGVAETGHAGRAYIAATLGGLHGLSQLEVTSASLTMVDLVPNSATLAVGTLRSLNAIGSLSDGTSQALSYDINWSSSDESIAQVSDDGVVVALAPGEVTIAGAASQLGGAQGLTYLTITDAVIESLSLTAPLGTFAAGTKQRLAATGTFDDASTQELTTQVSWSSSDEAVATVSGDSVVMGHAAGTVTIDAEFDGVSEEIELTVSGATLELLTVSPASPSLAVGASDQFAALGTFDDASTQDLTEQVTWISSDRHVAGASNAPGSNGALTGLATGDATVSAWFGTVEGTADVTVTP